jgi:2-polyprenyl-6-hydroxyphenyl methylase/3-demethylubiquinone-9 3-methyltransferase
MISLPTVGVNEKTKMQNVDQTELDKFASLSAHWWDTEGDLKTLHQINPLRLGFIKEKISLSGKHVLDIGCGGGILTEAMAKDCAIATGIDLNPSLIKVAQLHLLETGVKANYQIISAEDFAAAHPASQDIVTCLEMLEHVPDPAAIVRACAKTVKPGGHVFFSTLNRNPKSYLFAIVGAEYLLKILPKNTHDYEKFIRPSELSTWARDAGLAPQELKGISYHPLTKQFKLTDDVSVNYLMHAIKL